MILHQCFLVWSVYTFGRTTPILSYIVHTGMAIVEQQ